MPMDESVRIIAREQKVMAVRTFKGNWDDRTAENHRQVLAGMLKLNGIAMKSSWEAYRYNPPWT